MAKARADGSLRVVCFVNQFFGQLGGEEKAGVGPQAMDGAVGAARAVQQALGEAGTVVATVVCGDNYAAEQPRARRDRADGPRCGGPARPRDRRARVPGRPLRRRLRRALRGRAGASSRSRR